MKYTTNDLSKILNVSTNTIRRYEEKGFLNAVRNESNGYREFDIVDVEKLMYTSKYRKVGFSQEEILGVFSEDANHRLERFRVRMEDIDRQIAQLKAIRHVLKDDAELLERIADFGPAIREYPSCAMYYILYQENGNVNLGKEQSKALHAFFEACPEYEYVYLFSKDNYEKQKLEYSEGVATNIIMANKYGVQKEEPVRLCPEYDCIMRVIRLPLDIANNEFMDREVIIDTIFGQFNEYIKNNELMLSGDVFGIKLGMSYEKGQDWQYVLMQVPVIKKPEH